MLCMGRVWAMLSSVISMACTPWDAMMHQLSEIVACLQDEF